MNAEHDALLLLRDLEKTLLDRNISAGFARLDDVVGINLTSLLEASFGVCLAFCAAQWTDLGYRDSQFLECVFQLVRQRVDIPRLPAADFFRLRLIEAYRLLAAEQLDESLALLDTTSRSGEVVLPLQERFVLHFWKGRVHRKRGEYHMASVEFSLAQDCAKELTAPKLSAVIKIHESWLAFQRGERRLAFELLDTAEQELRPTGHALSLGNIESARGRFVRRSGDYERALRHFERAIEIYQPSFSTHPNLARALVNAAYVKRLIALDMKPRSGNGQVRGHLHTQYLKTSKEALRLLDRAETIYQHHHHQGGTGSVLVNSGHLHLESGDIDQAAVEGDRAFNLGQQKHDQILTARARTLQSAVELAKSEEQLDEPPAAAHHAELASQFADQAIELARTTQNARLLAEAYIARGAAAADPFFAKWDLARDFALKASTLLREDDRDHLFKELAALKAKIAQSTAVNETLRLWSDGQIGGKTFQQVQEEFAELVIPKVWRNLGRNTTLVAQTLSISPKKVRRILRSAQHGFQDTD